MGCISTTYPKRLLPPRIAIYPTIFSLGHHVYQLEHWDYYHSLKKELAKGEFALLHMSLSLSLLKKR